MFQTQKLANYFPSDSLIREDPSSLGFRFLSVFGDLNQAFYKDLARFKIDYNLFTSNTDILPSIYIWDVSLFDFEYESNGLFKAPNVQGDSTDLIVNSNIQDFLYSNPISLNYIRTILNFSYIIYESSLSSSSTIQEFDVPGTLYLEFEDVESFSMSLDTTKPLAPRRGASIVLDGEDFYGNSIQEKINLTRNGVYKTQNVFSKLLDFTLVNVGTSGTIRIKSLDFDLMQYISKYYFYIDSEHQSQLIIDYDSSLFYLKYFIFVSNEANSLPSDEDTLASILLKDEDSINIEITDITFKPSLEYLYVLSNDKIYIYNDFLSCLQFQEPYEDRTLESPINAQFLYRYQSTTQINKCYLGLSNTNSRVLNFKVKFVDPNDTVFYLNEDFELDSDEYTFIGDITDWAGDSVKNIVFDFILDTAGQWDIIIESTDSIGSYKWTTSIIVPYLICDKVIQLSKSYSKISYHDNGYIYLYQEDGSAEIWDLNYNNCYFDSKSKTILTIENYTNLDLNYE